MIMKLKEYQKNIKRSISPIIATILLIVMTVSVAAFTFIWMQGFLNNMQQSTSQQIESLKLPQFTISDAGIKNESAGIVYFVLYNIGSIPIDLSKSTIKLEQINKLDGSSSVVKIITNPTSPTINCTPSTLTVSPSSQATCDVNFGIGLDTVNYNYLITITYKGVTQSKSLS